MRTKVQADAAVFEHGEVTVPARTLFDLAKTIKSGHVEIAQRGKSVAVIADKKVANLATMPAKDYPSWPELSEPKTLTISAQSLRRIIDSVLPFAPNNDPRRQLLSVCLQVTPVSITAVATDGKILSRLIMEGQTGVDDEQILMPVFLLQHISKLLEAESDVTVEFDDRQIAVTIDGTVSIGNSVEGRYPNYEAVIPRDFGIEIDFPRNAMLTAVKSAMVMTDRLNLHVDLSFGSGQCEIKTENYDLGSYSDVIGANTSQDFAFCVNGRMWIAALSAITADTVTMKVNGPTTPVILEGAEADPMLLVMPIKKTELQRDDAEAEAEEVEA